MRTEIRQKDLIMPYRVREIIKTMARPLARAGNRDAQDAIKYCWLHREAGIVGGYDPEVQGLTKKEMFEIWDKFFNKKILGR